MGAGVRASAATWRLLVTPQEACGSLGLLPTALLEGVDLAATGGRIEETERLVSLLQDRDAVVLDLERITPAVLARCPRLRVLSRFGEGCDAIDLEAARAHGVRVARTRGVAAAAVAQHALTLLLALTHRVTAHDRRLKQGRWQREPNGDAGALTVGIAGYGAIGGALASLASAVGFQVVVFTRREGALAHPRAESLDALVDQSDIVSLHLPLTPQTQGIISEAVIRKLRGKCLVNTARGGLVDEAALLRALEAGTVAGYAADVFAQEPPRGVSEALVRHPRVIASPHVAALDPGTAARMTVRAVENALFALRGAHERVNAYVV